MIQKIIFLTVIVAVCCQYPEERAPPLRYRPAPEEYEEYEPPPRQAPPQHRAPIPNSRPNVVHKPASVHYVNIGLELAGDYKFGYDTGKGDGQSFREETRLPDGTVQGAYGYVDEFGRQRIVKYTAGKDGFKAEGDVGPEGAPKTTPRSAPAQASVPVSEPSYRPPPPAYIPQSQAAPRPQPQPYRPPAQTQPAYRSPPQTQPAYRSPPQPQPRPAYRPPPPQPAYKPEPEYQSRPRPQAPRSRPEPVDAYEEPDYDYPSNDIADRKLVIVDTSLFNYNIGTSQDKRN